MNVGLYSWLCHCVALLHFVQAVCQWCRLCVDMRIEGESEHVDFDSDCPNVGNFFSEMPEFLDLCPDEEAEFDKEYLSTSQLHKTCASINFDPTDRFF